MKPICKSEARWLFWRNEAPFHNFGDKFNKYAKKYMNKARRRFYKKEIKQILNLTIDLTWLAQVNRTGEWIMIDKPYFVILNHQKKGIYLPLLDKNEKLAMFISEIEATMSGNENLIGSEFGFEVFELGGGVSNS